MLILTKRTDTCATAFIFFPDRIYDPHPHLISFKVNHGIQREEINLNSSVGDVE